MATQADVLRFARANRDIRALVLRDLNAFWRRLDVTDALAVRSAFEDVLPALVAAYGEVAAAVAADFFDDMRETSGARGRFVAVLASEVDADDVRAGARWALGPIFADMPDGPAALARLAQVADRFALQPGRDTIAASVARDPADARWARVPVGKTCAFCLMLASRGPAYRSERSAGGARKFHADCDCTPTPVWSSDDLPEGYDPEALYDQYEAASNAARGGGAKAVLSELREQQHIR